MQRKVPVKGFVEQVIEGTHYKGYVEIDGAKLDYEIIFAVPVREIDQTKVPEDMEKLRSFYKLTLKRGDSAIKLSDEEYTFFLIMIAPMALGFCESPAILHSNQGAVGEALRGKAPFGIRASIGRAFGTDIYITPEIQRMLADPKFGCTF